MKIPEVRVGEAVRFAKTVGESDVYLFAGITGDFAANHVNEEYMAKSVYGRRIAHGALLVGYMSTASSLMISRLLPQAEAATPVSLGYDRVRFLAPVYIGDTVEVAYTVAAVEPEKMRSRATIEVRNQAGVLVAVGEHLLKWVADPASTVER